MKKIVSMLLVFVMLIGIVPTMQLHAETKYDDYAGYYYLAKGETVTFKNTHEGKLSLVSDAGNAVKISKNIIKVTGKKSGLIVIKSGKKKIGFHIYVGGNNKDAKVKYAEYALKFKDGKKQYKNFIDCIRDRMKKKKDITYRSRWLQSNKKESSCS